MTIQGLSGVEIIFVVAAFSMWVGFGLRVGWEFADVVTTVAGWLLVLLLWLLLHALLPLVLLIEIAVQRWRRRGA